MEDKLDFEIYEFVAKQIASRTGNALMARTVMSSYIEVAKTYNPIQPYKEKEARELGKELDNLANEHDERTRKIMNKLENAVQNGTFIK